MYFIFSKKIPYTFCVFFLLLLFLASNSISAEIATTYYKTKRNENLIEVLNNQFKIPKNFLNNNGQYILENIKRWNPQIKYWNPISTNSILYLEVPREVSPYYRIESFQFKSIQEVSEPIPKKVEQVPIKTIVKKKKKKKRKKRKPSSEMKEIVKEEKKEIKGFIDTIVSAQTGSYVDETPSGSQIETEKGLLAVGMHIAYKWNPKNTWLYYGDLHYNHSGSVTVSNSNSSFSNPNTWVLGAGIHIPRYWSRVSIELGLERKEISFLSYDKAQTITTENAASLLFGFKATFNNFKIRSLIHYSLGTKPGHLFFDYYQSFSGSGSLDQGSTTYTPTMELTGINAGLRQNIWRTWFLEGTMALNTMVSTTNSLTSKETLMTINIGSQIDL